MPIGSHIIPRFYLEQFSTPSKRKGNPGRVWVYERGKEPDERGTTVQGRENGYFEYVQPNGSREESLEAKLANIEGECNDTLASAKSELFDWSCTAYRNRLAFYAAMLFCRATQRRDFNTTNWDGIWQEFAEAVADDSFMNELATHYSTMFKLIITPATIRDRLLKLAEQMRSASRAKNAFLENFLSHAEAIKDILLQKQWRIWRAPPDTEFVTSDNPLISFVPVGNGELSPGYGFRFPGVVAAFPLAPGSCLAMGVADPKLYSLDASAMMKLNETMIRLCDRYVYSKSYSEPIQNMVDNYAGAARYGISAYLPLGIKLPKVKEFIRRNLRLDPEDSGT